MGFQRSTLKLKFPADSEFAGLEVSMRRATIGELDLMESLEERATESNKTAKEAVALFHEIAECVSSGLLGWNFDDASGERVPATLESINKNVDIEMLLVIMLGWMDAVTSVDDDLKAQSNSGDKPLPPENLRESLEDWRELEQNLLSANDSAVSQVN